MEELLQGKLCRGTLIWHPSVGLEAARSRDGLPLLLALSFFPELSRVNFYLFVVPRSKAVVNKDNSDEMLFRASATLLCSPVSCAGQVVVTQCCMWKGQLCRISEKSSPHHHRGSRLFV